MTEPLPPLSSPATARQLEVMRAMAEVEKRLGEPAHLRELMAELGIRSTQAMRDHLRALLRKRMVAQPRGPGGSYRLTPRGRAVLLREGER